MKPITAEEARKTTLDYIDLLPSQMNEYMQMIELEMKKGNFEFEIHKSITSFPNPKDRRDLKNLGFILTQTLHWWKISWYDTQKTI